MTFSFSNLACVLLYVGTISAAGLRKERDLVTNDVPVLSSEEEKKSEKLILYDKDTQTYFKIPDSDVSCLLNAGPCTEAMERVKKTLLLALRNDCANCDYDDQIAAGQVLGSIVYTGPELWTKFVEIHDKNEQSEEQVQELDNTLIEQ